MSQETESLLRSAFPANVLDSNAPYEYPSPELVSTNYPGINPEQQKKKGCCGVLGWRRTCWIVCIGTITSIFLLSVVVMVLSFIITSRSDPFEIVPMDEAPTAPAAPETPQLAVQSYESITLSWNEPDMHRSIIIAYEVQVAEPGGNFSTHYPGPGTQLIYEVTELKAGTAYGFRVRAINGVGTGNYSAPVDYSTLNATVPDPPSQPRVTATTANSVSISWTPGAANGATRAGYEVQISLFNDSTPDLEWETVFQGDVLGYSVVDLEPGTTYAFRIRAWSAQGPSDWSVRAEYHTDTIIASQPAFPFPLILDQLFCDSISVRWARPEDRGSEILYYEISFMNAQTNISYEFVSLRSLDSDREAVIGTGLESATRHRTSIFSVNSRGRSLPATAVLYTTKFPSAPDAPFPPSILAATPTSITLTWQEPFANCAPITGYQLQRDDWWEDLTFHEIYDGRLATFTEEDLLPAVTYSFRLTATNSAGTSGYSMIASFTTFDRGSCGNRADVIVVKENFDVMQEIIQSCLIRCAIGGTECALDCIMTDLGLSQSCAYCWVQMGQCTLDLCSIECLRPTSEGCLKCTEDKCFPETVKCTGMPASTIPR